MTALQVKYFCIFSYRMLVNDKKICKRLRAVLAAASVYNLSHITLQLSL